MVMVNCAAGAATDAAPTALSTGARHFANTTPIGPNSDTVDAYAAMHRQISLVNIGEHRTFVCESVRSILSIRLSPS